ncbi:MAG: ATP-binding protein, partial [Chloroflexota bacterium]
MDTQGKFYLGKLFDPAQGKLTADPLLYDSEDLTTHAVVVGMTGSGKTGLCVGLLEEAALNGLPALMVDPKGDITNLLLHFPNLLPADFQPWVNADEARRAKKTVEQAAEETAASWAKGLGDWGIDGQRIQALVDAAHFAIYTPGSDAGIPVSILASLKAPQIPWEGNREALREKIASTVTALLGLVGLSDIDPVRSREHILLSNIFEAAWSQGQDLHLDELILQTQNPPFAKLGVFDVNTFFPEKDRFQLAMLLNNILAAPAFQTWIEGQPLDVGALLYGPDGRPRHSVFYIAHLSDAERMFFVTLLFSAVESWMRAQSGTTTLRALVYFDEIFGYLPPIGNPPSKAPMLRMLKQARAFGVGMVLVTQNPVDIDYKGLSNAGTWMIGKLQTERDKARLLDGLDSAMAGAMDRSEIDRLISGLGKRVFLMQNVHNKAPLLFQTRWAMNYLAGPLSRTQIP